LNEVVRSFGLALQSGWKPLRTIVFASWDGEEYGLVGSTEWVEEFLPWLSGSAVAYLNVDVGARGRAFKLSAAPLLSKVVQDVLPLVASPDQTVPGQSVNDTWDQHIATMGSGSDFTAFQDFAGIASIDMGFGEAKNDAVYHYHSNYDSFDWMERFGDPGFHYHATIARVWAVVAAKLVETPVLQLSAADYATGLDKYIASVKAKAKQSPFDFAGKEDVFKPLDHAASHFSFAAAIHDGIAAQLLDDYYNLDIPWWKPWLRVRLLLAIRNANTKYKLLERQFLHPEGLDDRPWFKHVVFAPGKWTGYAGATFPGIVEGVDEKDDAKVRKWVGVAAKIIDGAADFLEKE
jgi:N-acetylated-alpha-linked acidic dipeptidase